MAQQLLLPLSERSTRWTEYLVGDNQWLINSLQNILGQLGQPSPQTYPGWENQRFHYIWGEKGCGLSYLMQTIATEAAEHSIAVLVIPQSITGLSFDLPSQPSLVLCDDIDRSNDARCQVIFNIYNDIKQLPQHAFIAFGHMPVRTLPLREDLRTRLGWGLVSQLHPLSDDHKKNVLQQMAYQEGIVLNEEVSTYLLNHLPRDLHQLTDFLSHSIQQALREQRPLTLPFLRQQMHIRGE